MGASTGSALLVPQFSPPIIFYLFKKKNLNLGEKLGEKRRTPIFLPTQKPLSLSLSLASSKPFSLLAPAVTLLNKSHRCILFPAVSFSPADSWRRSLSPARPVFILSLSRLSIFMDIKIEKNLIICSFIELLSFIVSITPFWSGLSSCGFVNFFLGVNMVPETCWIF